MYFFYVQVWVLVKLWCEHVLNVLYISICDGIKFGKGDGRVVEPNCSLLIDKLGLEDR